MKIRCLSCAIKNIFDCLGKEGKVHSNYLPCKEKTINVVYSNKKIVIAIKHLCLGFIAQSAIELSLCVSNYDVNFCSTIHKDIFVLVINHRLIPDHKFISNYNKKQFVKKKEIPIMKTNNFTITLTPVEHIISSNFLNTFDICTLHKQSKALIKARPIVRRKSQSTKNEDSVKGKSFEEVYQRLLEMQNGK